MWLTNSKQHIQTKQAEHWACTLQLAVSEKFHESLKRCIATSEVRNLSNQIEKSVGENVSGTSTVGQHRFTVANRTECITKIQLWKIYIIILQTLSSSGWWVNQSWSFKTYPHTPTIYWQVKGYKLCNLYPTCQYRPHLALMWRRENPSQKLITSCTTIDLKHYGVRVLE